MSILANPPSPCTPARTGWLRVAIGLLFQGILATQATAAPITYAYRGIVQRADLDSGVQAGDPFSGTITFDPAGPVDRHVFEEHYPRNSGHITGLDYGRATGGAPSLGAGMSLDVAGRRLFSSSQGVTVSVNSYQTSGLDFVASSTAVSIAPDSHPDEADEVGYTLSLDNAKYTPLSVAEWTAAHLDLADFRSARLDVFDRTVMPMPGGPGLNPPQSGRGFAGTIDSFELVSTPEPATWTLLGLGVAGWLIRSRRRADRPASSRFPEHLD